MNFDELVDEFQARGFDYLSDTRAGRYVNQAYKSLCGRAQWPFLLTTTTGTAPLTIADLRAVRSVVDTTTDTTLRWVDRRHLVTAISNDLTISGNPSYWYQNSRTIVSVYPANTSNTLSVNYLKIPTVLTGVATHIIPEEYEDLIIDGAVISAYKNQDDYDKAAALSGFYNEKLREMMDALRSRNHGSPSYVIQTDAYEMGG